MQAALLVLLWGRGIGLAAASVAASPASYAGNQSP